MLLHKLLLLIPAVLSVSAVSLPPAESRPAVNLGSADGVVTSSACTGFREFFGARRITNVQARWCLTQQDTYTAISQELKEPWYYYNGAWTAGGNLQLSWTTRGKVSQFGGSDRYFNGTGSSNGVATAVVDILRPKLASGYYDLSLDFHLTGPYWGPDYAVDSNVQATALYLD